MLSFSFKVFSLFSSFSSFFLPTRAVSTSVSRVASYLVVDFEPQSTTFPSGTSRPTIEYGDAEQGFPPQSFSAPTGCLNDTELSSVLTGAACSEGTTASFSAPDSMDCTS